MEEGRVMKVTGLQVLGYQYIIAEIRVLITESLPLTDSFKKRRGSLESLKEILNKAIIGFEILQKCQQGEALWGENLSLREAADAERAFKEVNNLLLEEKDAAKANDEKIALFQKIAGICDQFFANGKCPDEDRKILYDFCKKASHRLDFVHQLLGGIPRAAFISLRT